MSEAKLSLLCSVRDAGTATMDLSLARAQADEVEQRTETWWLEMERDAYYPGERLGIEERS